MGGEHGTWTANDFPLCLSQPIASKNADRQKTRPGLPGDQKARFPDDFAAEHGMAFGTGRARNVPLTKSFR